MIREDPVEKSLHLGSQDNCACPYLIGVLIIYITNPYVYWNGPVDEIGVGLVYKLISQYVDHSRTQSHRLTRNILDLQAIAHIPSQMSE